MWAMFVCFGKTTAAGHAGFEAETRTDALGRQPCDNLGGERFLTPFPSRWLRSLPARPAGERAYWVDWLAGYTFVAGW
jgi:hypothetical protein